MTPPLTLRPVARAEIAEAYEWYEERRQGLGEEFLMAVRDALAAVEQAPQRYPVIRNDAHRALVHRFPYSILYVADPEVNSNVLHRARERLHGLSEELDEAFAGSPPGQPAQMNPNTGGKAMTTIAAHPATTGR